MHECSYTQIVDSFRFLCSGCVWSVFIRGHEVSEENVVVIYVLVCVSFLQARQQAQMRHQMASDSKSEYAAYLEKFNKEQNEHYYTIIPNIFQVHTTALQCMIYLSRFVIKLVLVHQCHH